MEGLPREIVVYVLSFLEFQDLLSCCLLNRRINGFVEESVARRLETEFPHHPRVYSTTAKMTYSNCYYMQRYYHWPADAVFRRQLEEGGTIKMIVIGEASVGKTSLLERFCRGTFGREYYSTLGANYRSKACSGLPDGHRATMQLWDTAGAERLKQNRPLFFRHSSVAILCFDLSDPDTLTKVLSHWLTRILETEPYCIVTLCGTKSDLDRRVSTADIQSALRSIDCAQLSGVRCGYHETSAQRVTGVSQLFQHSAALYYQQAVEWRGTDSGLEEAPLVGRHIAIPEPPGFFGRIMSLFS